MPTTTTNFGFTKPDVGQSNWGSLMNTNLDSLDTLVAARESVVNKGVANGYAGLDGTGKVPAAQLPPLNYLAIAGGTMTGVITFAVAQTFPGVELSANKGAVNGYASLDGSGKVPAAQLPSMNYLPLGGGTMTGAITFAGGQTFPGTGTVSSVGLSLPVELTVTGSPVTGSGTLTGAWANQTTNKVFAAPNGSTGVPSFRILVAADIPALAYVTSVAATVPSWLTVAGSPITSSGTIAITATGGQTANQFLATPNGSTGAVGLRSIVAADIPALPYVTSVGLSLPAELTVSGSPITGSGTLSAVWAAQSANKVFAGPSSGVPAAPTYRALVAADIPALSYVTSVGLTVPSWLAVTGSPVTGSGTLAVTTATGQTANQILATPDGSTGAVGLRSIVANDLPSLSSLYLSLSAGGVVSGAITFTGTAISGALGVATSGANFNSDSDTFRGSYWNGSAAANDNWTIQNVLGTGTNPTSTLTCSHTGSSGKANISFGGLVLINTNGSSGVGNAALTIGTSWQIYGIGSNTVGMGGTDGSVRIQMGAQGLIIPGAGTDGYSFSNSGTTAGQDTWINRDGAARTVRIGKLASATPAANTLTVGENSRGATDSNISGTTGTIRTGTGTGISPLPKLILQVPLLGPSGTTQQVYANREVLMHTKTGLTNNTATAVAQLALPSGSMGSSQFCYTIEVSDGTDFQTETGMVSFASVNKAGVLTHATPAKSGNVQVLSAGTLAVTFTAVTNGSAVDLKVTSNSSLTPTTNRISLNILNLSYTNDVTPQ